MSPSQPTVAPGSSSSGGSMSQGPYASATHGSAAPMRRDSAGSIYAGGARPKVSTSGRETPDHMGVMDSKDME